MRSFVLLLLLTTSLLSSAACRRPQPPASDARAGSTSDRPPFGGDFALTDFDGRPFRLADLHGKVVLLFFGYTFCPDMCPMTIAHIMDVRKQLPETARSQVVPVFVSLDPDRDTPAAIKTYVTHFSPDMVGLTGSPDQLAGVARQYHVSYERIPGNDPKSYLINHTTAIFLIDRQGTLRQYFAYNEDTGRLAAAVQAVLDGR